MTLEGYTELWQVGINPATIYFKMSDYSFLFLSLGLIFLLLVQLNILSSLRSIRLSIGEALDRFQRNQEGTQIAHFELEKEKFARRVKYRVAASLQLKFKIMGVDQEALIKDISETGILFECFDCDSVKIGDSYPGVILLPDSKTIQTNISILRIPERGLYGASFDGLSIEEKKMIRAFVTQGARKELTLEIPES